MVIRIFVAIEIDKEIKNRLSEFLNHLKKTAADVKWVAPENTHLTLKFIGYIDETNLPNLNKIINNAISCLSPFIMNIENVGAFPTFKKPRVIYVCARDRGNNLSKIFERLDKGFEELDIKRKPRKYVGHITIGRIKSQKNISKLVNALNSDAGYFFGQEKVNQISLMQSKLTPSGPIYTKLNSFMLC
ncbi:MAG: RNA 2',3'-cyclic phosphodiesterase [Candidatus Scalinduaceae bacterium]